MSLAEQLNAEQVAHEMATNLFQRMNAANLPEAFSQHTAGILFEFVKIACGLILDEPGLENPATNETIPYDMPLALQGIELFCEGLYHTAIKCYERGIPDDLKSQFMQVVAQDIYLQTKQIIISTYGQDSTPEFQIPKEQQVEWINQTAESTLVYRITEYENQYGPIQKAEPTEEQPPQQEEPSAPEPSENTALAEMPEAAEAPPLPEEPHPMVAPLQPEVAQPHKGPHPHDKYAAVSLLLNTLRPDLHETVLNRFNGEERELITFYQAPEQIEQNLDLASVTRHLQSFKNLLKQGSASLKSKTTKALEALAKQAPPDLLHAAVKKERPLVGQYLARFTPGSAEGGEAPFSEEPSPSKSSGLSFGEILPPKVEEVLYHYLSQRIPVEGPPG